MKTLCVAVVLLSLTSVCQPASLACEKLLKPADKGPDLTGRWYAIALPMDACLLSTLLNSDFWPSAAVDITSTDTPKVYDFNFKLKVYGYCENLSAPFFHENNTIFSVNSNNAPNDKANLLLLHSGCPDCIVLKNDDFTNSLGLLSRRKIVTAAELKEFETQTECRGGTKLPILNTDHDYENCKSEFDIFEADTSGSSLTMYQRLNNMYTECLANKSF